MWPPKAGGVTAVGLLPLFSLTVAGEGAVSLSPVSVPLPLEVLPSACRRVSQAAINWHCNQLSLEPCRAVVVVQRDAVLKS